MSGLSGTELEIRRRGITLQYWHNESLEERSVRLSFGIPYEILLGILCNSAANVEQSAGFFLLLCDQFFDPAALYLSGFVSRLVNDLDFNSCELAVKPMYRFAPIDFPRPSPARICVWNFFSKLSANEQLFQMLVRIPESSLVFRLVSGKVIASRERDVDALLLEAKKFRDSLGFTATPEEIDAAKREGRE